MALTLTASSREVRAIGLIGIAHGLSHFYQLVLPPMFLIINPEMGYSFTQLGLLISIFYTASGLCQAPVGFVVDRFGARPVLYGGLGLLAGATMLYGVFPDYGALVVLVAIAGIGNSVFHPADFSILSATVEDRRMGRAFGFHAFAGLMGYAVTPVTILFLADAMGWRGATIAVGVGGLVYLAAMMMLSGDFRDSAQARDHSAPPAGVAGNAGLLLRLPILMFLLFFIALAMAQIGIQTFTPAALQALHGTSDLISSAAMNAFLMGLPVGVLAGGILAERTNRHNLLAVICMAVPGVLLAFGGLAALGDFARIALFAISGVVFGAVFPARDLLVRAHTPSDSSGKVFGFVYSGLDIGSALTPVVFGWLIDNGMASYTFVVVSACYALSIVTIALSARSRRAPAAN